MADMRPYEVQEKQFLTDYYRSAIGLTIVDFKWREQADMADPGDPPDMVDMEWYEQFPVLVCRTPDGEIVELDISQDEEGNGRGFIFGLERPQC